MRIVHEDQHVLVLDKPAGISTAVPQRDGPPATRRAPTLFDHVRAYVRGPARTGHGRKAYVIHRLDKFASGLVVFAKSERAFARLKDDLKGRKITRIYLAAVEGRFREAGAEGTMQSLLFDNDKGSVTSVQPGEFRGVPGQDAQPAITHYRVLETSDNATLVRVRLGTGRRHQIRVHMAEQRHPIVGDRRYGAKTDPFGHLALRASELRFTHPVSGEALRFTSPLSPSALQAVGLSGDAEAEPAQNEQANTEPADAEQPEARQAEPAETQAAVPIASAPAAPPAAPIASPPAAPADPSADDGSAPERTDWNRVAEWYDELIAGRVSDHYEAVIFPGVMRLLGDVKGARVLDVACGQGEMCRRFDRAGASGAIGLDAAERLIEAARTRAPATTRFITGDARQLPELVEDHKLGLRDLDAATCVMALTNIDPIDALLRGVSTALKPGGRFVMVVSHPAFRTAAGSAWGWDPDSSTQFRRTDGYIEASSTSIIMNPGDVSRGADAVTTWTFHRPVQAYVEALSRAGLVIDALEEWSSKRTSQPGPRADAENRARREIPLFMAIRAVKPNA